MFSAFVVLMAFILVPLALALLSVSPTWVTVYPKVRWQYGMSEIIVLIGVLGIVSVVVSWLKRRHEINTEGWVVVVLWYVIVGSAWIIEGLCLDQLNIRTIGYQVALKALAAFGGFGAPLLAFWLLPSALQGVERDYVAERVVIGCASAYMTCLAVHWYLGYHQWSRKADQGG